MVRIHFPSMIPMRYFKVLLHAPFSSTDAMTCVTLESHVFSIVTPDNFSNSTMVSYNTLTKLVKNNIYFVNLYMHGCLYLFYLFDVCESRATKNNFCE